MGSDTQAAIQELLKRGRRRGFVTSAEIQLELEVAGAPGSALDQAFEAVGHNGIEVVDDDPERFWDDLEAETAEFLADPVDQYLREIGRVPLLTARQEVDLGMAKDAGVEARAKLAELDAAGPADPDEEYRRLTAIMRWGEQAEQRLVKANLRLVVSVARRYVIPGVSMLDLVQEGNVGLMRAAAKFDYRRGYKFSTYATWWIRQTISRALNEQKRIIRVPEGLSQQLTRLSTTRLRLYQESGREPTIEELGAEMDLPVHRVLKLAELSSGTLSLDASVGDSDDLTLGHTVQDKDAETAPEDGATLMLMQESVALAMEGLDDRERKVITMRYGLADGRIRTLQEVSDRMGVTKERIRQLEIRALRKMRSQNGGRRMHSYLRGA
ncbi:sigma-70 family RNA polymerase sigma factor [Candidatus Spongiisocius sp.]|uniref:sigma-70 family RNA polymerase sigma factor n=1 Tax=Candidatus Spongiisocius sp. TaxID=3101273 RepID=UPI003B5C7E37